MNEVQREVMEVIFGKTKDCEDNVSEHTRLLGENVIVRTYSAGVFYGKLIYYKDGFSIIRNCRQIYRWKGKCLCLVDLAETGNISNETRLSTHLSNDLEVTETIEILKLSKKSYIVLEGIKDDEANN